MKHTLTTLFVVCLSFTAALAQETPATPITQEKTADKAPQTKVLSKEEQEAARAKRDSDLQEAFKTAGFTDDEQKLYRKSNSKIYKYTQELKTDNSLSEEEVKAKVKEFRADEEAVLKENLGAAKFKAFKDAQKAQREAMKAGQ